jgi:hypothetical protein
MSKGALSISYSKRDPFSCQKSSYRLELYQDYQCLHVVYEEVLSSFKNMNKTQMSIYQGCSSPRWKPKLLFQNLEDETNHR